MILYHQQAIPQTMVTKVNDLKTKQKKIRKLHQTILLISTHSSCLFRLLYIFYFLSFYLHIVNLPSSSSNQISSTFTVSDPNKWVLAPVFVPNQNHCVYLNLDSQTEDNPPILSYADVVNNSNPKPPTEQVIEWNPSGQETVLCPYLMKSGICRYETCTYDHGLLCELCGKFCLDPLDADQRKLHHTVN